MKNLPPVPASSVVELVGALERALGRQDRYGNPAARSVTVVKEMIDAGPMPAGQALRVAAQVPNATLRVVGEGSEAPRVRRLVADFLIAAANPEAGSSAPATGSEQEG